MHDAETVIGLLAAVAAVAWAAARLKVPYSILLVLAGLAIGFVPGLPRVELRPDLLFLLFLPPLLYYPALLTSWRDFKSNLRPIALLSIGLVLFTTCAVAAVAHYVMGLDWAPGFVLGAIVSPPDAVAATSILQRLRIPRRVIIVLEGESLVNDASALVAYRFAVKAVLAGTFSLWDAGFKFVLVAAGGIVTGYLVGHAITWLRPRLRDHAVEGIVSLLTPFVAYLPAEWLGASGVLATVTAGIYVGRQVPRITTPSQRLRLYATWDSLMFLLNGVIFILIGLQIPLITGHLRNSHYGPRTLILYAACVALTAVIIRILWVYPATYLPRWLFPKLRARDPSPSPRTVFVVAWVGLRGIVSLAAAMALPRYMPDGVTPFPARDLIEFITFGVILATLVLQGLTLPAVIRRLGLHAGRDEEREESLARRQTAHAALARLEALSVTDEAAAEYINRARQAYRERLELLGDSDEVPPALPVACRTMDDVHRHTLTAEREMLIRLRDDALIGDEVFRRIQQELDLEESRLAPAGSVASAGARRDTDGGSPHT
jgi:CPA1 family monovalent cation:H+ antiporter